MPRRFFWIALANLLLLIGLFLLWHSWSDFRDWLPDQLGPLPIEVPLFGALGGSVISLSGIFTHSREWDPRFNYWHYARPLVGGVIGSVGALVFFVLAELAGSNNLRPNPEMFDVVAFLVGYAEANFRELMRRATEVFIGPGSTDPDEVRAMRGGTDRS